MILDRARLGGSLALSLSLSLSLSLLCFLCLCLSLYLFLSYLSLPRDAIFGLPSQGLSLRPNTNIPN